MQAAAEGRPQYDIFPRTWGARLLLALAFLGGLAVIGLSFTSFVFTQRLVLYELPCSGPEQQGCLQAQTALRDDTPPCDGYERRVCLVPLGHVDPDLVRHLIAYYRDEYRLDIGVVDPIDVPEEFVDAGRKQVDANALWDHMSAARHGTYWDPNAVLIGLTPVDLYDPTSDFRFVFGVKGTRAYPTGVVSTYRMYLDGWRLAPEELVFTRARKLVTKYVGLMYYYLPPSDDPRSPMYGHILSVDDLDRMTEPLPVPSAR